VDELALNNWVYTAKYAQDGTKLITMDEQVCVWNLKHKKLLYKLDGNFDDAYVAEFNPDGNFVISALNDNTIKVWEAETGKLHRELKGRATHISFGDNPNIMVARGDDGSYTLWNIVTGEKIVQQFSF